MKKLATLIILFTLFGIQSYAQLTPGVFENYWGVSVFSKIASSYKLYSGAQIEATIMYKDINNQTIYTEDQVGVLNENSFIRFNIGKGINPQPPVLSQDDFRRITSFCWTIDVITDEGIKSVSGMEVIKPNIFSNYSNVSLNSEKFSGNSYSNVAKEIADVFKAGNGLSFLLQGVNNEVPPKSMICPLPVDKMFQYKSVPSAVTSEQVNVVRMGTDKVEYEEKCYHIFGNKFPDVIDSKYQVSAPFLQRVYNLVGLEVGDVPHPPGLPPRTTHNTSVLYVINKSPDLSAGIITSAGTWGLLASGKNGTVGSTTGNTNGSGIWGTVGQAPAAGGYKYGLLGSNGGFADSWAAAINGIGWITQAWTITSDARLKTEVRSQTNALDQVMHLRPTTYLYRHDLPIHFPDGMHHGFIAQEMEEVFPELVQEIKMPTNIDAKNNDFSGTAEYKGINYDEMIPILTAAMQELNIKLSATIEEQAATIVELRKRIEKLEEK